LGKKGGADRSRSLINKLGDSLLDSAEAAPNNATMKVLASREVGYAIIDLGSANAPSTAK